MTPATSKVQAHVTFCLMCAMCCCATNAPQVEHGNLSAQHRHSGAHQNKGIVMQAALEACSLATLSRPPHSALPQLCESCATSLYLALLCPCSAVQLCQYAGSTLNLKPDAWDQQFRANLALCTTTFTALLVMHSDQVGRSCFMLASALV